MIESEQSIGYFIASTRVEITQKILLIFNEFNSFKEDLYNSIVHSLGNNVSVDIVFHNYNRNTFDMLLAGAAGKYTVYVVMSGKFHNVGPQLEALGGRVILLDHFEECLKGKYSSVSQNFADDTYAALVSGLKQIRNYREIILVQKSEKEPEERYDGLKRFCSEYGMDVGMVKSMENMKVKTGTVYLTAEDRELVNLINTSEMQKLVAGHDFGIISYNDTVLKEILCGGITTLSTDFIQMGRTVAEMICEKEIRTVANPWHLNIRKSL